MKITKKKHTWISNGTNGRNSIRGVTGLLAICSGYYSYVAHWCKTVVIKQHGEFHVSPVFPKPYLE